MTLVYSFEEQLMGTAGAAKRLEWFLDEAFIVVYGDVFSNVNLGRLIDFHYQQKQKFEVDEALTFRSTECRIQLNVDWSI